MNLRRDRFSQLSRHERQIERSYYMAVQQLERLQYARTMGCDPFYAGNIGKFTIGDSRKKEEGTYRAGTRQS